VTTWDAVDTYINAQLVGEDAVLDAALARAAAAGLRPTTSRPTRASCCTCSRG
jgi:hypothetical protein